MNYLAHIYLSYQKPNVMIGNFIADAVKGNKYEIYNIEIQKGIILHRNIDTFTDQHSIVRQSKRRLHKRYNHYNGIIIDLFYDHYLAKNWSQYSKIDLDQFTKDFYKLLDKNFSLLPDKIQNMIPHLKRYNWIYNYQFFNGMQDVLNGMNRRTGNKSQMHLAIQDLKEHYNDFQNDFTLFFEELINYVNERSIELDL